MVGLSACESVKGRSGKRSRRSSPTCSSWAGLTVDHSRQTATASTSSAPSRSTISRVRVDVERLDDLALRADPLGHLERQRARDVGIRPLLDPVEDVAARLADEQHVGMALRRQEGGAGGGRGEDRVDRARRAVDQVLALSEQLVERLAAIARRQREHVEHALGRIARRARALADEQRPVRLLDDEVREGPADIDREPHRRSRGSIVIVSPTAAPRPAAAGRVVVTAAVHERVEVRRRRDEVAGDRMVDAQHLRYARGLVRIHLAGQQAPGARLELVELERVRAAQQRDRRLVELADPAHLEVRGVAVVVDPHVGLGLEDERQRRAGDRAAARQRGDAPVVALDRAHDDRRPPRRPRPRSSPASAPPGRRRPSA